MLSVAIYILVALCSVRTNYDRCRERLLFQISAICHLINYAVYIPDFKGTLGLGMGIVGALFGGYGAAIYWVSQGGYMMKLFKKYGIKTNE